MDDYFAGSTVRPQAQGFTPSPSPQAWGAPAASAVAGSWAPPVAPPPNSSSGRRLLIGLLVAVGALMAVGIVAAVAIPAMLGERDLSRRTAVAAPASVLGMPRLTDAMSSAAEAKLFGLPGPGDHVAGVYGVGSVRLLVGVARYHLGPKDRAEFLDGAASDAGVKGMTLRAVDAGKLGGSMRCGTLDSRLMTLCVFADGGSYGVVVLTGGSDDDTGTARGAREAFVHRT